MSMDAISITIKVMPKAGRQAVCMEASGRLKVYVQSPPEDGKANTEVIRYLAERLGISPRSIEINKGHTAQIKRITIHGIRSEADFFERLNLPVQKRLCG